MQLEGILTKHIAIIGSGISGLVSAYLLSKRFQVSLFEANDYLGGHTNTFRHAIDGQCLNIDTGFIVFNKRTYPHFCKLLDTLQVPYQASEMSFSYRNDAIDLEYNGHNLNTLFADRRLLYRLEFYRLLKEIYRFNYRAKAYLDNKYDKPFLQTIKLFLQHANCSTSFINNYFIPMVSSIWSNNKSDVFQCSAEHILGFFENHGLLDVHKRPQWYVVTNGSSAYIPFLLKDVNPQRIHLNTPITAVERSENQISLVFNHQQHVFDAVVLATHSDQALQLLTNPSYDEQHILSAIKYNSNQLTLHTDISLMPKRQRAWASWNYLDNGHDTPTLTYYMNRLQSLKTTNHFFVSMNLQHHIDPHKVIKTFDYQHPYLNTDALSAQKKHHIINGKQNTFFVGSYWGHGFHEDGVSSALTSCQLISDTLC